MAGERTVKIKFTGESKGVDRAARSAERAVRKLSENATRGVASLGEKIAGALSGVLDALPPQGKALAVALGAGLVAALAPIVGAAVTAAVLFAVGGGVLALGIKAAASNPRVKSAFGELKKTAQGAFQDLGAPFVDPLVRAAKTFQGALDKTIGPSLKRMGALMAPVIDRLAPALAKFFERVMPGIENAVKASKPLFDTLAEHLPKIGEALRYMFDKIAQNGPEANVFFDDLLGLIEGLIVLFGDVIAKLASWYIALRGFLAQAKMRFAEFKVFVINQLGDLLDRATAALGWIPGLGPKLKEAQGRFRDFRAQANKELAAIKDRQVRIEAWTNVFSVVKDVVGQLSRLPGGGGAAPRRASGGPVSAGRSYLVGERGPEILTMGGSANGSITPNRELGQGGDVYEIHVDLGGAVREVIRVQNRDIKRRATARGAFA